MSTSYLPGLSVTLNDLGLRVFPDQGGTKVTLLGYVANTGIPLNEPLRVTSLSKAIHETEFYPLSSSTDRVPGELSLALEQVGGSATNIEIMAIGYVSGVLSDPDSQTGMLEMFVPTSGISSSRYSALSGAYDVLRHHPTDIVVPVGATIDDPWYDFGTQLADACYQATAEGNDVVGVTQTFAPLAWAYTYFDNLTGVSATLQSELQSFFGTSGDATTVQKARSILFGTPSSELVNYYIASHGTPDHAFVTNYPAWYKSWLSGACDADGNYRSSAESSASLNASYWTYWQAKDKDGNFVTDDIGNKVDAGGYISVMTTVTAVSSYQTQGLAAPASASLAYTNYNATPTAGYAGLIASLRPESATTNKTVDKVSSLKAVSASQASDLVSVRHVTMLQRANGFTVAKDVTGAHNVNRYVRSDYNLLTTMRIAQAVVTLVRSTAEPYIGEPNTGAHRSALETDIDSGLKSLQEQGVLQRYSFVITSTPDQQVLGEADIALTIVPAFELTNLNLVVSLAKS